MSQNILFPNFGRVAEFEVKKTGADRDHLQVHQKSKQFEDTLNKTISDISKGEKEAKGVTTLTPWKKLTKVLKK